MAERMRWGRCLLVAAAMLGCNGGDDPVGPGPSGDDATSQGDVVDTGDATPTDDATEGDADGDASEVELVGEWRLDELDLGEEFVLRGVWGSGPDQLVAVGNKATIIEYDGEGWQLVHQNTELDTLNGVWGAAPDDVWAVGALGAILHKGPGGWNIGTGCNNDGACDDSDPCTVDTCGTDGQCVYEGSGAPGCCGAPAFTTDFEAGIGGWLVTDTSPTKAGMVWQAAQNQSPEGEPRATSGTTALYFGDPDKPCLANPGQVCPDFDASGAIVGASATSPTITLPEAGAVTVTFQVFIDAESSSSFDKVSLLVVDSGLTTDVWTKQDVGGATSGQFVPATADISSWAGKPIQLRFLFDSTDGSINDGEGVYIDDLRVDTTCGTVSEARFPTLWGVWGTATDDVFAVGNEGTILHWDGQSWKRQLGGETTDLFAVSGNAEALVAAGGAGEIISTFGGGLASDKADTSATLRGVAVQPDGVSVAVGDGGAISVYDGAAWTAQPSPTSATLRGVWSDGDTAFAVGDKGTIVTGTPGGAWTEMESPVDDPLNAVWGASADNLWAVGDKVGSTTVLVRYDGESWKAESLSKINAELRAIHGVSDGPEGQLVVAVGGGGAIAENVGGVWSKAPVVTTFTLHGVWGASGKRLFAVGNQGVILERTGGQWTQMESPTTSTLYAVWGRADDDVYAVGQQGNVIRWDGMEWTVLRSSTSAALRGVWGLGPDRVYAVGTEATIMQFNGLYWSQIKVEDEVHDGEAVPVTDQLLDVWGRAPDDIYAVGANGAIIHTETDPLTGSLTWVKIPQEVTVTHRGVWGDAENLWVVGRTGSVYAFNGLLEPEDSGTIATLYDVLGFGDGELVAVGDLGTVVRRVLVPAPEVSERRAAEGR